MRIFMRIFNAISLVFLSIFFIVTILNGDHISAIISAVFIIIDIIDIVVHYNDF